MLIEVVDETGVLACGEAQYVDLSAQCVMTWTMLNAMDAHAIQGMDVMRYGITQARRAGLLNEQVLNTWALDELLDWLKS